MHYRRLIKAQIDGINYILVNYNEWNYYYGRKLWGNSTVLCLGIYTLAETDPN